MKKIKKLVNEAAFLFAVLLPISSIIFSIFYFIDLFFPVPLWLMSLPFDMIVVIIITYVLVKFYYSFAKKLVIIKKLSKDDFFLKKDYYRDLIKNYNLIEVGYVDDFQIDINKDLVVILLSMELRKIISLKYNKIKILKKEKNLKCVEKYIIDLITKDSLSQINMKKLEKEIQKDCVKDGLLVHKSSKKKNKTLLIILLISIVFIIIFAIISEVLLLEIPSFIIALILAIKDNEYYRTKKGKEVNKQLEGLKKYIKDFSLLNEKDYKDIALWDDYLIYSVLFNQNKKIVNEINKKFIYP